jgi:hypothetical protein
MTDRIDDAQALWQEQPRGEATMSLEEIRERARRMERRVARRNLREYVAAVVVVPTFGYALWVVPSGIARIGAALIIAATLFVVRELHVRGAAAALPAGLALQGALDFHRTQLTRQRDLLREVWSWYILPFVPGMLLMLIGFGVAHPERIRFIVAYAVALAGLMIGLHLLNRRAATGIQRRLDELPRL